MQKETGISVGGISEIRSSGRDVTTRIHRSTHWQSSSGETDRYLDTSLHYDRDLNLEVKTDYIRAIIISGSTLSLTKSAIDAIMNAAELHNQHRILIDSRRQYAEPSIVDCFEFAKHLAAQKPWLNFLVAVVVQSESVEAAEFAEIVAKNRGIVLKIFSHESNAVAWLRNGKDVKTDTY